MSDIVERLRGAASMDYGCQCDRCEAADEIERLRAELSKKIEELAEMRQQRDEAQEEVCQMVSDADQSSNPDSAKEVAERRGWDCFKRGGGA